MSQVIIKFNIGGKLYQVSQSLLDSYPDSMLAKSANDQWHKDPEAEIFIDRSSTRFEYVLDYMRDGKVSLPPSVTKESLIVDLQYYGIENINEDTIDDKLVRASAFGKTNVSVSTVLKSWNASLISLNRQSRMFAACTEIVHEFSAESAKHELLYVSVSAETSPRDDEIADCNKHLKEVGLRITKVESGGSLGFIKLEYADE